MFDPAQNVIKNLLEQKYYPEFLAFISCPVNLLSITSNEHICCERKTSNKYLEILYSDQKLDGCRTDRSKQNSFHRSNRLSADQFTDSAMLEPTGNNVVDIPTLKQDCGHDENKQRTTNQSRLTNPLPSHETSQTVPESSTSLQTPRNPNYPNLSSGLVYDNQSSNVLKESYPSKLHPPVRKQTNLAESDPVSFVQLLTDRLEK
ncbi:unnamed protein product [Heterobilharzia americana]|nr:unnamed protein product [Heterobilharzia americana]